MTATSSPETLCARIAQRLADDIGPRRYAMWFDRSAKLDYDNQHRRLDVTVPNRFVADWIHRHFDRQVRNAAEHELGHDIDLRLEIRADLFQSPTPAPGSASGPGNTPGNASGNALSNAVDAAIAGSLPAGRPGQGNVARRGFNDGYVPRVGVDESAVRRTMRHTLRHALDNFIVGPSNQLVYAAACRVSDLEQADASPLFIHGGCGLGKTHLLQGICRRVLDERSDAQVLYVTGEQFTNEFLAAVRANNVASFRHRMRKLDLLAVDDVHFLANKQATQQEFLHCIDALDLHGARLVLASDNHPKLISQFSDALVSRCVRGLVAEVRTPDTITRAKLIRAIAQRRGIPLMDSVVDVLATRCTGSVREIEGTLTKLQALASLTRRQPGAALTMPTTPPAEAAPATGTPSANTNDQQANASEVAGVSAVSGVSGVSGVGGIGHVLVNQLFAAEISHAPRHAVRFDTILATVSDETGVPRDQILGSGRQRAQVLARSMTIHLARQMTSMSYPEIAAAMGRGSHSTIITADQRLTSQLTQPQTVTLPHTMEQLALADLLDRLKQAVLHPPQPRK